MAKWGQAVFDAFDVASAATIDLTDVEDPLVRITGTTGITAITMNPNQLLIAIFVGALTVTHNGTTLNLPGATNWTTAANIGAILSADDSANVRVLPFPQAVVPIAAGGTGATSAATAFSNLKQGATTAATGVVELATDAETVTGTDTARATTPSNITARLAAPGAIGGTTPAAVTCTTLTANGNVTLGDAAGDTVVMNAKSITKPNAPLVLAYNSATDSAATGDGTLVTVDLDTEIYDRGSDFASDTYTAAVTGPHSVGGQVRVNPLTVSTHSTLVQVVTSNRNYRVYNDTAVKTAETIPLSSVGIADMDAGDTLVVQVTVSGGTKTVDIIGGAGTTLFTWLAVQLVG